MRFVTLPGNGAVNLDAVARARFYPPDKKKETPTAVVLWQINEAQTDPSQMVLYDASAVLVWRYLRRHSATLTEPRSPAGTGSYRDARGRTIGPCARGRKGKEGEDSVMPTAIPFS